MAIEIVQVKTEEQWQILKSLLVKLFEYENALRTDRKDFSENIDGPFSYVRDNVRDKDGAAFLALDGDQPVGFGSGYVVLGDGLDEGDNRRGYFSDAFVVEQYRGRGIYKKLVDARIKHFSCMGVSRVMVDTLGTNTQMQKILEKTGFSVHKIFYEMKV